MDLFVDSKSYRHFHWNTGGRFTLDLTAQAPVRRIAIGRDDAAITFHGLRGQVSIASTRGLPADPRPSDTPRGTALPFETTAEILSKKLLYRMAHDQDIVSHDLYDLAYAQKRDPASLHTALAEVRPSELRDIDHVFQDHSAAGATLTPLIAPSDPQLEKNAPAIIHQLIRDELHQRPPAGPERGPTVQPSH